MRSVEAEGSTIDDAIARALVLLHIGREKVDIEILESPSRGLLGFGGKKARIRATVRGALSAATDIADPEGVSRETSINGPCSEGDAFVTAQGVLVRILSDMGLQARIQASQSDDGSLQLVIHGDGAGIIIGRHGQTLDAIEYILNRIASHQTGSLIRISVDIEGYRSRRQESLEQQALHAAETIRQTGRPVTLDPMSPRDRRAVHMALSEVRGVATRSEGEGGFRHVVIVPAT